MSPPPPPVRTEQDGTRASKKHTPKRKATKKAREADDVRVLSEAMKRAAAEKTVGAAATGPASSTLANAP